MANNASRFVCFREYCLSGRDALLGEDDKCLRYRGESIYIPVLPRRRR